MICPVCGKEAKAHLYHCGQCGRYVHEKCWATHEAKAHPEEAPEAPLKRRR